MNSLIENTTIENHPIMIVELLKERYGSEIRLEFSKYVYIPQSLDDKRQTFVINIEQVNQSFLLEQLSNLQPDEELSLNSRVYISDGKVLHIPMIDFICPNFTLYEWEVVFKFLPIEITSDFFLFDSGSSFHGYGLHLLTLEQWITYMFSLTNLNLPNKPQIIDSRWIGHRGIARYGSLRWSRNTSRHSKMPEFVKSSNGYIPSKHIQESRTPLFI